MLNSINLYCIRIKNRHQNNVHAITKIKNGDTFILFNYVFSFQLIRIKVCSHVRVWWCFCVGSCSIAVVRRCYFRSVACGFVCVLMCLGCCRILSYV